MSAAEAAQGVDRKEPRTAARAEGWGWGYVSGVLEWVWGWRVQAGWDQGRMLFRCVGPRSAWRSVLADAPSSLHYSLCGRFARHAPAARPALTHAADALDHFAPTAPDLRCLFVFLHFFSFLFTFEFKTARHRRR